MDINEIENAAAGILRLINRNRELEKLARLTHETRQAQNNYFAARITNSPAARDLLQHSKAIEARLDTDLTEILNLNPKF